jgi:hypothetical protein
MAYLLEYKTRNFSYFLINNSEDLGGGGLLVCSCACFMYVFSWKSKIVRCEAGRVGGGRWSAYIL